MVDMSHVPELFWMLLLAVVGLLVIINAVAIYFFIAKSNEMGHVLPSVINYIF